MSHFTYKSSSTLQQMLQNCVKHSLCEKCPNISTLLTQWFSKFVPADILQQL